jgi:hypothetical protein
MLSHVNAESSSSQILNMPSLTCTISPELSTKPARIYHRHQPIYILCLYAQSARGSGDTCATMLMRSWFRDGEALQIRVCLHQRNLRIPTLSIVGQLSDFHLFESLLYSELFLSRHAWKSYTTDLTTNVGGSHRVAVSIGYDSV